MSVKTWMAEYYPIEAHRAAESNIVALKHSIKKWKGLRKVALKKHGVSVGGKSIVGSQQDNATFYINDESCALCSIHRHYSALVCLTCPLWHTLGARCDSSYGSNPYGVWVETGNPKPMIKALEETLKRLKSEGRNETAETENQMDAH